MSTNSSPTPPDPRVLLAAERTLLAWVRTGLALMGFGFIVARFGMFLHEVAATRKTELPPGRPMSLWFGLGLLLIGVAMLGGATWRYQRYVGGLNNGREASPPGALFGVVVATLLIAVGVGLAVYLATTS